jgi:ubiquinone/menaquinone biosynthesis C-methylase UbiE
MNLLYSIKELNMRIESVPTRGRTLDYAAFVYDFFEPILLLGKQADYDRHIRSLLELKKSDRVLDLGCGTGVLTRMIADQVKADAGGISMGIDAAAKMIRVAMRKRGNDTCRFKVMAAENLSFDDASFDAVVSSLFFHHVPLDLKEKALLESFRVLRPNGRLIIADMHSPTTRMGALVSHVSRWFFMQPQIGENIKGILPALIEKAGFAPPNNEATYFGYIAIFSTRKTER